MKTMKKLVALFAAATMAMSMGISAYADIIEPDISEDNDELIINVSTTAEEQLTMMAYLVPDTTTEDNIPDYNQNLHTMIALDQVAGNPGFTTVPIATEKLEDGKVIAIKIGGSDFELVEALIVYDIDSEEPITFIMGDVNNDTTLNVTDVSIIIDMALGKISQFTDVSAGTVVPFNVGDVNNDSSINVADVSIIIDMALGKISERTTYTLPVGTTPESTYPQG